MQEEALRLTGIQRLWRAGLSGVMGLGLLVLRFIDPAGGVVSLNTPLTQRVFGLPCPFCGITRGTHEFLNGEVLRALYLNMSTGLVVLVAGTLILFWGIEAFRGRELLWFTRGVNVIFQRWKMLAGALVIFWVVHLSMALSLPKPELLDRSAPLFPEFLLKGTVSD